MLKSAIPNSLCDEFGGVRVYCKQLVTSQLIGIAGIVYRHFLLLALYYLTACSVHGDSRGPISGNEVHELQTLISSMTLEQKVGQMVMAEIQHITPEEISNWGIGAVLNGGGSHPFNNRSATQEDWLRLADGFRRASTTVTDQNAGIPLVWATDAVHGHNGIIGATLFPHNIGLGAANDKDLLADIAAATAREVRATGVDWVFAPTVAVPHDDRWGRTYESYSDRPDHVARLTKSFIKGLQSGTANNQQPARIIATAKHFIGDGGTLRGVDQGNTELSETQLLAEHSAGYVAAIDAGVASIMASFSSWNGQRIHGHSYLLGDVLRNQLKFNGVLISDWNGIGQVDDCNNETCVKAVNAGIDMFMVPSDWKAFITNTVDQVRNGEIKESRINEAVRRIMQMKKNAGVFSGGLPSASMLGAKRDILGNEEHRSLARKAVRQSLVLLKNNGQTLPLDPVSRVLIAGEGADNIRMQSGGWSIDWQGASESSKDFPGGTSIYDGIKNVVDSAGGSVELSENGEFLNRPDVAIVVFGEQPYAEKHGDTTTLEHQPGEKRDLALLQSLKRSGIPVVAVLLSGRPLWVNAELNASDAFVAAWLPGSQGAGVSDLLFADQSGKPHFDFTGRLSFDWPATNINTTDYTQPVQRSLFPYGYGLSYQSPQPISDALDTTPVVAEIDANTLVFDSTSIAPWAPAIGDSSNWSVKVKNKTAVTAFGELRTTAANHSMANDAIRIDWTGSGARASQFYWQAEQAFDWSGVSQANQVLLMSVRVNRKPAGQVLQRMDCRYPCSGTLDLTEAYQSLALGKWSKLAVKLSCFSEAGTQLKNIDTPLLISTVSAFSISISKVEVTTHTGAESIAACAYQPDNG